MTAQGSHRKEVVVNRSYSRATFCSFHLTQYHSFSGHKLLNVCDKTANPASTFKVLNYLQIKSRLRHWLLCDPRFMISDSPTSGNNIKKPQLSLLPKCAVAPTEDEIELEQM